jgi:hypothetical protein
MVHPVGLAGYGFQEAQGPSLTGQRSRVGIDTNLPSEGPAVLGARAAIRIRERPSSIESGRSGCALILWAWRL